MEVFDALENRVQRLISAYQNLRERVAELEKENAAFRSGEGGLEALRGQVAALEAQREEVRTRLEKLLATLKDLDV